MYNWHAETHGNGAVALNHRANYSNSAPAVWANAPRLRLSNDGTQREFSMPLTKTERAKNEFCLCGCGIKIGKSSRRGYTSGHFYRSEEGRLMMSERHTGKVISAQQRQQISAQFKGRIFAPETITKLSETKRGALNPNWRGGVSLDPYPKDWWFVRTHIRKRDGGVCLLDPTHSIKPWKHADIHHMDSDQNNCDDKNLISLCRSCHGKVEKDWEARMPELRAILTERYGYVYS